MVEKKRNITKNKPQLASGQRTLLDLFPVKKVGRAVPDNPESSTIEAELVNASSDHHDIRSALEDEPPSSPIVISEASSTPSSYPEVVIDDEERPPAEVQNLSPGGSQEDPILICSSPPKVKEQREPPQMLWSIFASPPVQPTSPTKRSSKSSPLAPFPSAESQHVRGTQTTFASKLALDRRYPPNYEPNTVQTPVQIQSFLDEESSPSRCHSGFNIKPCCSEEDKATCLGTIPKEHKDNHPAIERAISGGLHDSTGQLWMDKWRPECAAEVLGNEKSALYLRDWLRALALEFGGLEQGKNTLKEPRGIKRPRVVRTVEKRRGRKKRRTDSDNEDDGWIVYEDESEEDTPSDQGHHELPYAFEQLANTIILAGPPGCGKTACVYACAEELDWDVFEVYPGIGKRNGASIENMIGEVGTSHLVRKAVASRTAALDDRGDNFGFLDASALSSLTPRQSLVLLEEVDILFKDDLNFWPTIINFLKGCKRPVICTCNDISLIPTSELPLQSILVFEPCPSPIAASYLQAACCNEGWAVDREALVKLYETSFEDGTNGDGEVRHVSAPDLRRSMNQVQLWCTTSRDREYTIHEPETRSYDDACSPCLSLIDSDVDGKAAEARKDQGSIKVLSEVVSYLDSANCCSVQWLAEGSKASGDDEVGHTILYDGGIGNGYADRSTVISSTATRLARGTVDDSAGELFRARVDYSKRIGRGLEKIVPRADIALQRREIYMEYVEYVRMMVRGEDAEEEEWNKRREEGMGRKTRNSNRYCRVFGMGVEERRQLGI